MRSRVWALVTGTSTCLGRWNSTLDGNQGSVCWSWPCVFVFCFFQAFGDTEFSSIQVFSDHPGLFLKLSHDLDVQIPMWRSSHFFKWWTKLLWNDFICRYFESLIWIFQKQRALIKWHLHIFLSWLFYIWMKMSWKIEQFIHSTNFPFTNWSPICSSVAEAFVPQNHSH